MKIRQSREEDIERMVEIYDYARDFMAKTGNPNQWGPTGWPPEEILHQDIASGNSYVCLNDQGKGIGAFCINWCLQQCGHMRIDTHTDNVPMQRLVQKLGFLHCGTIYVEEDDYPRLAYEKV